MKLMKISERKSWWIEWNMRVTATLRANVADKPLSYLRILIAHIFQLNTIFTIGAQYSYNLSQYN